MYTSTTPLWYEGYGSDLSRVIRDKIKVKELEDNFDAFYVGDMGDIVRKHKIWKALLPRVEPFYAVKCNDDTEILKVLAHLGTGFDCASKGEIQKVMDAGVVSNRIIYANPCKQSSHIKYAAKHNVALMTFDNETELHKVKEHHPNAKMVIRILPPANKKVQCELGMKFGCQPKHADRLLQVAKKLDVDVVGVSFHVGSGCYDPHAYAAAVESAHQVFETAKDLGFNFELLDIGGGFPGQDSAKLSFREIVEVLRPALDHFFPEESGVRIIAEPGRFYVASAFTLTVSVIASRQVTTDNPDGLVALNEDDEPSFMHYVNDGVYGSFNCILFDHAQVEPALPEPERYMEQNTFKCSLWGPTCDGLDCIIKECYLPRLETGDWLVFKDMGAYTMSAASCFNGMPKPKCFYVIQDVMMDAMNGDETYDPLISGMIINCPSVMRTGRDLDCQAFDTCLPPLEI